MKAYTNDTGEVLIFCPGCRSGHSLTTKGKNQCGAQWSWNGSLESPTFSPSLLIKYEDGRVCHSFITDGMIRFLDDCTHDLRGKTVPLEEF